MIRKQILVLILISTAAGVGVWALLRFTAPRWDHQQTALTNPTRSLSADSWSDAIAKVKEDRSESPGAAVEIPPQLRHYSDRRWFLATQVAEVQRYNIYTCQDFVDLAGMIERGELLPLPALSDTYILYGVGARADDSVFSRFVDDRNVELYTETQLRDAYARLESARATLKSKTSNLRAQPGSAKKTGRARHQSRKESTAPQEALKSPDDEKARLDQFYGTSESRQRLFKDYETLQRLAKNFAGRSYNLENPLDRQAMKVNLLSSLRPQALKVLEEIAAKYHANFNRPLPVSSLVRPEQYQQVLHRVNRNAVIIDTPPHSTGLAFDIDYRYMGTAEQSFLMAELARLKDEGRIEVLRERSANYHVFVFINGTRPNDELIAAAIDKAGAPDQEANHAAKDSGKAKAKPQKQKKTKRTNRKPGAKKHR